MHVILGGTGHVGSAAAKQLLDSGEPVTIVSRNDDQRRDWERLGAKLAVADVLDPDALREVFRQGTRAFLLNPPADPSTDTDAQERRSVASILQALEGSGLQQVVAESTMGAKPGDRLGDLNVLHEFEQGLRGQAIPASVVRGAYYMSNWDASLETAGKTGRLDSFYLADFAMPMVAPEDLGRTAARLLTAPRGEHSLHSVEGPRRYSAHDVADAFASALGKPVEVTVIPREQWQAAYRKMGFSQGAAESYARMTADTAEGEFEPRDVTEHGTVTLQAYVDALVRRSG